MNAKKMKDIIIQRLDRSDWKFVFDAKNDKLRIEDKQSGKGMDISLPGTVSRWEESKEKAIDEVIYHIVEAMKAMTEKQKLDGKESTIYPVIRSASFPTETKDGKKLIYEDHTAETRIYYAVDLGNTYRLLDEKFAKDENWDIKRIKEVAKFNIRSLEVEYKQDTVAGNTFFFFNKNDGYDASRILNEQLLEKMNEMIDGKMVVAIPHQDVLIIGDIQNDDGYNVIGQMAMSFFAEGRVPITALPFEYEDKELEPIFVLVQTKQDSKK